MQITLKTNQHSKEMKYKPINYGMYELLFENKHNIQTSNTANLETNILFAL